MLSIWYFCLQVVRDPRFESLCGNLDVEGFRKRYDFLFKNNLPAEKEELKKQLKKSNDPKVIDQLKERISWIEKQTKFESTKQTDAAILAEHKKKEREAAKQGKRPFYLKKCISTYLSLSVASLLISILFFCLNILIFRSQVYYLSIRRNRSLSTGYSLRQ